MGYCAIVFDGEPAYSDIEGRWLSDFQYVVVHRLAVSQSKKGKGYGKLIMQAVETLARKIGGRSFRIDTNYDNPQMLGIIKSLRFTYCGKIHYSKGERMAFEKILKDNSIS